MARGATDLSTQDKVSGTVWIPFACRWGSLMWRFDFDIFLVERTRPVKQTNDLNGVLLYDSTLHNHDH